MKRYTFEIVIKEGNDEFWEELERENKTGCDEIMGELKGLIESSGAFHDGDNFEIRLVKFSDER